MSRTYCEFMNESSVFTGYCCSCNLVQIWCRDPIAMLMSMQHLGCLVLHEALTICLFSTWFSRTTWHQMYLDWLGLFRGCSNFAWMALQDRCKHAAKELCSVFFQFLWMVAILLSDVVVSLVSLRLYISYHMWYWMNFDGHWVFWGFSRWRPWTLRYGWISSFHPLNTRTSIL